MQFYHLLWNPFLHTKNISPFFCVQIHRLFIYFAYMHQHFDESILLGRVQCPADKFSQSIFPPLLVSLFASKSIILCNVAVNSLHMLQKNSRKLLFYHLQIKNMDVWYFFVGVVGLFIVFFWGLMTKICIQAIFYMSADVTSKID